MIPRQIENHGLATIAAIAAWRANAAATPRRERSRGERAGASRRRGGHGVAQGSEMRLPRVDRQKCLNGRLLRRTMAGTEDEIGLALERA